MRRAFALALTLLVTGAAHAATDDTVRRGFNVQEGGKLTLRVDVGDVTIVSGGTGLAVEIVRSARTNNQNRAKELFEELDIDFSQSGNDVKIVGEYERRRGLFNWDDSDLRVKWNIRVPARYDIDVHTSGGDIKLDTINGRALVKTSGGDIEAQRIIGPFEAATSGGDIELDAADDTVLVRTSGGDIRIGNTGGAVEAKTSGGSITLSRVNGETKARTSGGDIRIDEARGSVDASTSGGSITARFTQQPRGDSRLSTSGGGVNVSIAGGIGAEIDARASGGGIDANLPITIQGKQDDDQLQGTVGAGGPRLTLRTSGGGIRIQPLR